MTVNLQGGDFVQETNSPVLLANVCDSLVPSFLSMQCDNLWCGAGDSPLCVSTQRPPDVMLLVCKQVVPTSKYICRVVVRS